MSHTSLDTLLEQYSGVFLNDGLSHNDAKKRYKKRRQTLLKQLKEPAIIFGMQTPIQGENYWLMTHHPLHQDPFFLFLTGINQEHTALYLNPKTMEAILLLPKKNLNKEFWEGPQLGSGDSESDTQATTITGIKSIRPIKQLSQLLQETSQKSRHLKLAYFLSEPSQKNQNQIKDNTYTAKKKLEKSLKNKETNPTWINRKELEFKNRLCLDSQDINNFKVANKKSKNVFLSTVKHLKQYNNETEVSGHIKGEIIKQSAFGESFPAIVASSKNATTLHYHKNNSPLKKGGLLLLDFGVRHFQVTADISRTVPINGVFNPLQKCLYSIVLDAQKAVEKCVRAGVTTSEINTLCWDTLESLLNKNFIDKGGKLKRAYSKSPHNVSHLIAHCVHDGDPYRNYREMPLEPGMVISNEPGLYGYFEWEVDGKWYKEDIGIRIEDNLLITKSGCENLSKAIPKTIAAIESAF
ncbi:peptidase M24 [Candidatus Marinamargulisbacteria bacterium SCGC AAA071-K20]|nr:peptidase M24 [Candidatus Marinamargulisbacteria bacterium SCGC AAA071-K20]